MSCTIAVIADTHLGERDDTAQDACLDWALDVLGPIGPDVVIVAGDVTAMGTPASAHRFREKMEQSGLPFFITPGNSDRRSGPAYPAVRSALATPQTCQASDWAVLLADTSQGVIGPHERTRLEGLAGQHRSRTAIVVTHWPPETLDAESSDWFADWVQRHSIRLIVAAHQHVDRRYEIAGIEAHVIRGLDPDKAIGGPPAITLFEDKGEEWHRREVRFPAGTADDWPKSQRREFHSLLGFSCSNDPLDGLHLAAGHGVPCVELRANAADVDPNALTARLSAWRGAGGNYLSWHMPTIVWDADERRVANSEQVAASADCARRIGVQAMTVHVPRVPIGVMQPHGPAWEALAAFTSALLAPAAGDGVVIGIENMHMNPHERPDETRGFGYLPGECLAWIDELRGRLSGTVGMLLDVGHARNNAPYSSELPLGTWYATVGAHAVGYHLHQVRLIEGRMRNHQPVEGLHGPLVSFSSFLWAWHTGQLRHAPIFLEVPDPAGRMTSLELLRKAVGLGRG